MTDTPSRPPHPAAPRDRSRVRGRDRADRSPRAPRLLRRPARPPGRDRVIRRPGRAAARRARLAGLRWAVTGQIPAEVRTRVLAEHHATTTARRRAAITARVREGTHPVRVPFGYRVDRPRRPGGPAEPQWALTAPPYEWVRDSPAAATVTQIMSWSLGGHSDAEIAVFLAVRPQRAPRPIDPRTGHERPRWSARMVAGILTDPVYTGHQTWGRTRHGRATPAHEWIRCPRSSHPPLIDQATYRAIQECRRARRPGRHTTHR